MWAYVLAIFVVFLLHFLMNRLFQDNPIVIVNHPCWNAYARTFTIISHHHCINIFGLLVVDNDHEEPSKLLNILSLHHEVAASTVYQNDGLVLLLYSLLKVLTIEIAFIERATAICVRDRIMKSSF